MVIEEIADEVDQIVETTRWGNQKLLDGTFQSKFFQTGPDHTDRTNFNIMYSFYAEDIGLGQLGWETSRHGSIDNLAISEGTGISSIEVENEQNSIAANGFYRVRTLSDVGTDKINAKIVIDYDSNGYNKAGGTTWRKTIALQDLYVNENKENHKNNLSSNTVLIEGLRISFNPPDITDPDNPDYNLLVADSVTSFEINNAQATNLDVSHHGNAIETLKNVDIAIEKVNHMTANVGAKSQRLSYKEDFLATAETNVRAASSRIEDADVAKEQLESSRLQILQNTGLSMMAQSMFLPQNILSLFQ